ncbi:MAG TPA: LysE family translocator [Rhizobacter sp.]|nr:LysE family translocator [Rhizobacter sp.]
MFTALGIHDVPLFAATALLLNLTPGADMLFVATTSAATGRRAGLMAAWGVGAGCLVHVALAAAGLSALLAASDWGFAALKWAGAAYLVWMGLALWCSPKASAVAAPAQPNPRSVFCRGALTNALNPKVALFFLAFLPQFIAPDAAHQARAFVLLGLWFSVSGTLVNLGVGWLAASASRRLLGHAARGALAQRLRRLAGLVFVGLGLKLALASSSR